ncbi:MAG: MotA/TolQ/ExbB proton channel family protein [Oscillospiraceae bacterium]|nr:MotA/TolQ/ExbB proton channel family protein [Oscillospiraceae bacterium]MBR7085359.1 MotA/TolQ/ExbB proton channel family protein [Oscillospiraceae bacterium]
MEETFWEKLFRSIRATDSYILIFAVLAGVFLMTSLWLTRMIDKDTKANAPIDRVHQILSVFYTLFVTFISLFPLLGMFGTVRALLELDLSGDLEMIKLKFFNALTSTAWGIVFSVFFKILHAIFQPRIETRLNMLNPSKEGESS